MNSVVFDSFALLAFLLKEQGYKQVEPHIDGMVINPASFIFVKK